MTLQKLKEHWKAQPFEPFAIHLADGRSIPVRHPDFLARSVSGRTVTVEYDEDRSATIDLLLVTSLDRLPQARGASRKRR